MNTTLRKTTRAKIAEIPLEQWHAWFAAKTGLIYMAAQSRVSQATIAKFRRSLGYKHWPQGGYSKQLYTRADAKAIAKAKRGGKTLKKAAELAGLSYVAAKTLSMRYRDLLPACRHLKEVNRW